MAGEKRYLVFVSSTYGDLLAERQRAMTALLELGHMPAGMELFPATSDDVWTTIKGVIAECDYYLVIIGGCYGSVDSAGVSYTELEYEYALSLGKPIIAFVHGDIGQIVGSRLEQDPAKRLALDAFRAKVERSMVKMWTNPGELEAAVLVSMVHLARHNPQVGWVRADEISAENEAEVSKLRGEVIRLTGELTSARATRGPDLADLAQGEDPYAIPYAMATWHPRDGNGTVEGVARLTWDEIFAQLGPLMLPEGAEDKLTLALQKAVREKAGPTDGTGVRVMRTTIGDAFQRVKVHLVALKLITLSLRRHRIGDDQPYWSLTPAGEEYLIERAAIRRPTPPTS